MAFTVRRPASPHTRRGFRKFIPWRYLAPLLLGGLLVVPLLRPLGPGTPDNASNAAARLRPDLPSDAASPRVVPADFAPPADAPGAMPPETARRADVPDVDPRAVAAVVARDEAAHGYVPSPSPDSPPDARPVVARIRPRPDLRRQGEYPVLWAAEADVEDDFLRPVDARVAPGDLVTFPLPVADGRGMEAVPVRVRRVVTDVNRVTTLTGEIDGRAMDLFFHATDGTRAYAVYKSALGGRTYTLAWNDEQQQHLYAAFDADVFPAAACANEGALGRPASPRRWPPVDLARDLDDENDRRALAALQDDGVDVHVAPTPLLGETASAYSQRVRDYEDTLAGAFDVDPDTVRADAAVTSANAVGTLVVYDVNAASFMTQIAGSPELEIAVQIAQTNWIYTRSLQNNAQLDLLASHQVDLASNYRGDVNTALDKVLSTTDGVIDEVHVLRDAYGADLVSIFINPVYNGGWVTAGVAYYPVSGGAYGFGAVWAKFCDSRSDSFTFTHEVGHNLGARHAREQSTQSSAHAYAAGHWWSHPSGGYYKMHNYRSNQSLSALSGTDSSVCTVMTYEGQAETGYATQLPFMSNPGLTVNFGTSGSMPYTNVAHSVALGTSIRDNVRVMKESAATVIAYRTRAVYAPKLTLGTAASGTTSTARRYYYVDVPAGTSALTIALTASANVADLGINGPSRPYWAATRASAELQQATTGSGETQTIANPPAGRYHITVERTGSASASSTFTLRASTGSAPAPVTPSTPTFSPDGGTHSGSVSVVINCANAATLRYTTDNSTPSASNGGTLAPGGTVTLTSSKTLKAVGINSAGTAGPVKTASYTVTTSTPTATALSRGVSRSGSTLNGSQYYYFDVPSNATGVTVATSTSASGDILDLLINAGTASSGTFPTRYGAGDYQYSSTSSSGNESVALSASAAAGKRLYITLAPYSGGGAYTIVANYTLPSTAPTSTLLTRGVTKSGSTAGGNQYYHIAIPANATNVTLSTATTASGDILDLLVNVGAAGSPNYPTGYSARDYQYSSASGGGNEYLPLPDAVAGRTLFITVAPYSSGGAYSIVADYTLPTATPLALSRGVARSGTTAHGTVLYYFDVPSNATNVTLATSTTLSGDILDLLVNVGTPSYGSYPTNYSANDYTYGSTSTSGNEYLSLPNSVAGRRLYIAVAPWSGGGTYSIVANCTLPAAPTSTALVRDVARTGTTANGAVRYYFDVPAAARSVTLATTATTSGDILDLLVNVGTASSGTYPTTYGAHDYQYSSTGTSGNETLTLQAATAAGKRLYITLAPYSNGGAYSIRATCAMPAPGTPTLSPAGGTFPNATTVTLRGANATTLRYTTDGSNPTATHGTAVAPGGSVRVAQSCTLRVVGVSGGVAGPVAAAWFTIGGTAESADGWRVAAVGDFNGDGRDDILWRHAASGKTRVFRMNGKTVAAQKDTSRQVGASWTVAGVGDFNKDGRADILWRDPSGRTYIWFMNDAAVSTASAYTSKRVDMNWRVEGIGDFNNDGRADILWRHLTNGKTYIWLMNGANVLAASNYTSKHVGDAWSVMGVGDFNNDGRADVLWRNTAGQTYIWFMSGTTVSAASTYTSQTVGADWTVLGVADMNGDQRADILWRNRAGRTYVWFMNGAAVQAASGYTGKSVGAAWAFAGLGDFDNNGRADILWSQASTGAIHIWLMNGTSVTAASGPATVQMTPAWRVAAIADFDGDGHDDLLWRNPDGATYIWFMNGTSVKATSGYTSRHVGADWTVAGAGYFNDDRQADILWRASNGRTFIWFMNGTSVLTASAYTTKYVGHEWRVAGLGDFNFDGRTDVLWRHASGRTYVWLMYKNEVQAASGYTTKSVGLDWTIAGVGDFSGDGRADILWRNAAGRTYIWFMSQNTVLDTSGYTAKSVGNDWVVEGVAPFDQDARADVLWRHVPSGRTYLWLMNGKNLKGEGNTGKQAGPDWGVVGVGRAGTGRGTVFWRHRTNHTSYVWTQNGRTTTAAGNTAKQVK